jgi:hypothetical protein
MQSTTNPWEVVATLSRQLDAMRAAREYGCSVMLHGLDDGVGPHVLVVDRGVLIPGEVLADEEDAKRFVERARLVVLRLHEEVISSSRDHGVLNENTGDRVPALVDQVEFHPAPYAHLVGPTIGAS